MAMRIRQSSSADLEAIRQLHLQAFGESEGEAVSQLALQLLQQVSPDEMLSLVAEQQGEIIANVIFSRVSVDTNEQPAGYILCPLAVMPTVQRCGIGKGLIREGLQMLTKRGAGYVLVLGDPDYYSRSGFHANHQLDPPYPLPYPQAWLAQELEAGVLANITGSVRCADCLMVPEYW